MREIILVGGSLITLLFLVLWKFEIIDEPSAAIAGACATLLNSIYAWRTMNKYGDKKYREEIIDKKEENNLPEISSEANQIDLFNDKKISLDEIIAKVEFEDRISVQNNNVVFKVSDTRIKTLEKHRKKMYNEVAYSLIGIVLSIILIIFLFHKEFYFLSLFFICLPATFFIIYLMDRAFNTSWITQAIRLAKNSKCTIYSKEGKIVFDNGTETSLSEINDQSLHLSAGMYQDDFVCLEVEGIDFNNYDLTILTNIVKSTEKEKLLKLFFLLKKIYT